MSEPLPNDLFPIASSMNLKRAKLATRLSFLAAGLSISSWAPLVPFAKSRLGVNDAELGLILLCLGIGSVVTMPFTGWLSARIGSKPIIICGGLGMSVLLPVLASTGHLHVLAITLFGFGASLGMIDVAMNAHAVEVEHLADKPLMSGFHAMYSGGGIIGAGGMTFLLSVGMTPLEGAVLVSALTLAATVIAWPRLLAARGEPVPLVAPHGTVILLAVLCAVSFLVEGAILDWGALLVIAIGLAGSTQVGLGYTAFSVAMTLGRLSGDHVVGRTGDRTLLVWSGVMAVAGFAVLLTAPVVLVAMAGFLLIGFGASNIVPILFRLAGRQSVMPPALAVAALTTTGYAGILVGPAGVGFVSHAFSLPVAFWCLAALMAIVPFSARRVTVRE